MEQKFVNREDRYALLQRLVAVADADQSFNKDVQEIRKGLLLQLADAARALAEQLPVDRTMRTFYDGIARKRAGERNVPWHPDPVLKWAQVVEVHPDARVGFSICRGRGDEEVLDGPRVRELPTHEALVACLKKLSGWKGGVERWKWYAYDEGKPQWATGYVELS